MIDNNRRFLIRLFQRLKVPRPGYHTRPVFRRFIGRYVPSSSRVARLLAVDAGASRDCFHLDVVLSGLFTRLLRLLLRAERRRSDVTDETRTGVLRPVTTLQREVPVGHVLRRIRRQRLIPLDGRSLLLHFHVTQNGDQHHEDHEAHAATHDQAQPSRKNIRQTAPVAHRAVAHYRIGRIQSSDLRAPARR